MKRAVPLILVSCLVLGMLGACSDKGNIEEVNSGVIISTSTEDGTREEPVVSTEKEQEEKLENDLPVLYDGDDLINKFLLRYNDIYLDTPIGAEDFSVYTHHGRAHKDQIIFNENQRKEVVISSFSSGKLEVYVDNLDSDEEYKRAFIEYAKVYNLSLTDAVLEGYWEMAVNSLVSYTDFDEFELHLQRYNEITDYFQLSGKMED